VLGDEEKALCSLSSVIMTSAFLRCLLNLARDTEVKTNVALRKGVGIRREKNKEYLKNSCHEGGEK